eukprot:scaffold120867_cov57-Phaeocystis_antarctica.AAC.2
MPAGLVSMWGSTAAWPHTVRVGSKLCARRGWQKCRTYVAQRLRPEFNSLFEQMRVLNKRAVHLLVGATR